jgi:hypothetical protein
MNGRRCNMVILL